MTEITTTPELPETIAPPEAEALERSGTDWGAISEELDAVDEELVEGDQVVLAEVVEAAPVVVEPVVVAPSTYVPPAPIRVAAPTAEQIAARQSAELVALEARYALSAEESAEMFTDPGLVLPRLLAKMHQQAMAETLASVQAAVPNFVQSNAAATRVESEARNAFFSVNDDLAKPEFEDAILRIGDLYRQVNPRATREAAIEKVGELARVALGLPSKGAAPAAIPVAAAPVPFTPSRGGTGAGKVGATKGTWEQLNSEFDESDGY